MSTLATKDLTIRFGGHVAVNAVTCSFEPGTLTAIVGPNGAGKTTYFNLISGQLKASGGSVHLNGRDLSALAPSERARAGLGRAFQLTNLFPNLPVLENVRLAVQAMQGGTHRRGLNLWSIWSDHRSLTARAEEILRTVALWERREAAVASLAHGDQRTTEIMMALATRPRLLLLDEPAAGMGTKETFDTAVLIRRLHRKHKLTIVLVEHDMRVIFNLADRITVLSEGEVLDRGTPDEIAASEKVKVAYLGEKREGS